MADVEPRVVSQYNAGGLLDRFLNGLDEMGVPRDGVTVDHLKAGDEFHTGGLLATDLLLKHVDITPEMHVLDIGSGVGGPARLFAHRFGCRATGVDLTPEFVAVATALTDLVGLSDRVTFQVGSALDLPLADNSANLGFLLHVGMNIADKAGLFAEAARVLVPGSRFVVFDVMKGTGETQILYPQPWADDEGLSFLVPPDDYLAAAETAGFTAIHRAEMKDFALDFFARTFARIAEDGQPPLGIHLMMGATAGEKLKNYVENVKADRVVPTAIVFHLPE